MNSPTAKTAGKFSCQTEILSNLHKPVDGINGHRTRLIQWIYRSPMEDDCKNLYLYYAVLESAVFLCEAHISKNKWLWGTRE